MNTSTIQTIEPFSTIFPIDNKVLSAVVMDMRRNGYDAAQPVVVWKGTSILIDGHTRLEAARLLRIEDVPVVEREFASEDEAVHYAIHLQRDRRNLTDADIVRLVAELDKRKAKGARTDLASSEAKSQGKTAAATAKVIGTSRSKVEKVRTICAKATPEVKAAVASGKMRVNAAYQTTRKKPTPTTALSPAEQAKLAECERTIESGLKKLATNSETLRSHWMKATKAERKTFLEWVDRERFKDLPKGHARDIYRFASYLRRALKHHPHARSYVCAELSLQEPTP